MNEYINMVDGVKPTEKTLKKLRYVASQSGNKKGCNWNQNKNDYIVSWKYYKTMPTRRMIEARDRINALCEENGIKKIPDVDTQIVDRKGLAVMLYKKNRELADAGVDITTGKIHCGDCRYFRRTVGRTGYCTKMRAQVKAFFGCANAEVK